MTYLGMFWLTRLDKICMFFEVLTLLSFIISVVYAMTMENEVGESILKKLLIPITITLSLAVCIVFIPTTKEASVIYLLPKIVNNERVFNIADNTLKILEGETRRYLEQIVPYEKQD